MRQTSACVVRNAGAIDEVVDGAIERGGGQRREWTLERPQTGLAACPRPIKVSSTWVGICCALFVFDLTLLIFGAANVGLAYGASTRSTLVPSIGILVVALALYVYRVVVQDKKPLQMRLPAATMPEEERALDAPTTTV